jgi:hypothetical protein
MFQQVATIVIVGAASLAALSHLYKGYIAAPLSKSLLKRGKIKLAMKMRAQVQESGCGSCGSDSGSSCHSNK